MRRLWSHRCRTARHLADKLRSRCNVGSKNAHFESRTKEKGKTKGVVAQFVSSPKM